MTPSRDIREVDLTGNAYERGMSLGVRLRDSLQIPDVSWNHNFVEGCYEAACNVWPPVREEFRGIVDGGEFDRERLLPYYFARVENLIGGLAPGCTMFGIIPAHRKDGSRGALIGRNYDWATDDLRWCELHRVRPADHPSYLSYTHHWAGHTDVLTDNGLYIAIASLPPEEIHAPGMQWHILVEMLATTCTTVEEAVRKCASVRHLRPMSYLLADASGNVGIVEGRPMTVKFREPQEGIVAAANLRRGGRTVRKWSDSEHAHLSQPLLPDPANYDETAEDRARRRVDRARRLLGQHAPEITRDHVGDVLQDHEAPICTGDHTHEDGSPRATIWSGICEPEQDLFSIAPGLPCRHSYRDFSVTR